MSKIGFFGGTFDPIHFGHLNLAIQMLETQHLDQIYICPAGLAPHKKHEPPHISQEHRKAMVKLAIQPIENIKLIDLEMDREGPSYTIDTVRQLMADEKKAEFRLLMGSDMLEGLPHWKDIETLLKMAPPLVAVRPGQIKVLKHLFSAEILDFVEAGLVSIPVMEISSTEVRRRLHQKKYCGHLIPAKVLDYITEHHLYYY